MHWIIPLLYLLVGLVAVGMVVVAAANWAVSEVTCVLQIQAGLTRLQIRRTGDEVMSAISDKIAELDAKVTALEASDSASTQAVLDAIARLEAKIAEGGAGQADLDALEALKARVDVLKQAEDDQKAKADSEVPPGA